MKHKHKEEELNQEPSANNPFAEKNEEVDEDLNNEAQKINDEVQSDEEFSNDNEKDKLQEAYDNLNNQYIRLAADFENFRKRQAQERETLITYGAQDAMKKLIEVLDNFDRAKKSIDETEDVNQVKESFNVLYNQMFENLSKLGLEVIKAQGEEFNPNYHEAVMQTQTSEHPENHVIMELQKGYKLGDKVLRPTLVNVATNEN